MTYPPYPLYKPSGVAWLGDVPTGWEVKALRYLFQNLDYKRIPVAAKDRADMDKIYPYYGASGVIDYVESYIFSETLILVAEDGANLLSRSTPLAFIASGYYWVNNHAHILKPIMGDIRFWMCVLQSFDYSPLVTGAAQPKLTADNLGTVKLPVPPIKEQLSIADFLDRQTARIDTLIAKRRALIEKLKEKRSALISRTVTRGLPPAAALAAGLDPYPPLKPSGVEWLGDVPVGWEVKRLKYSASVNDESLPETTDPSFEFSYVDISSVDPVAGIVNTEEMVFEDAPSRARRIVREGDTIVSTVRTYLRAIAPIRACKSKLIVSTGFAVIRPRTVDPDFLSYALQESGFVDTIVARSVGVSYPAVNASEIATISIPLPSPFEQRAIANFLDRQTAKIDRMVSLEEAVIARMQEYRSALITAAVTGKIDVRGGAEA